MRNLIQSFRTLYIYLPLLAAMLVTACTDDPLLEEGNPTNPNAITFSAFALEGEVSANTRSNDFTPLEPLELTAGNDTLYLHTYDAGRVGFRPGEQELQTRGMQVSSADLLLKFHENFKVSGHLVDDNTQYLGWSDARIADSDRNVWYSARTVYWPASESLRFHAVSPASEFSNLSRLDASNGVMRFDYTAPKGEEDKDAEMQADLLLASYQCDKKSHSGLVPLDFHHALSAVKFAVRDVLGGEVVNVTISGVRGSGSCTFTADSESNNVVWSGQKGNDTFSQDFNYILSDRVVDPADSDKDEVLTDKMPEKTFMMIPQRIPADAEIIVTLRRNGVASGLPSEITVRGKIRANGVEEWRPGHEYIYTISTSKDNWVYVLNAKGNDAEGTENIYVYSPNDDKFVDLENTGYYSVRSYRYRANNQNLIEDLPWTAEFDGSEGYLLNGSSEEVYPSKFVMAKDWIKDLHVTKFSGNGGTVWERHNVEFYPHHVVTDWEGDKKMQLNRPYFTSMTNPATPYDLSTFGGRRSRSTANCYIVDRGGWYSLPLVYGNALKEGALNEGSYKCSAKNDEVIGHMTDYNGSKISGYEIKGAASASLIWEDAYNMITEVSLEKIGGETMLRFYVDSSQLQQGNAIVAVKDAAGVVMWSWHIWATEHWLDSEGYPNAISSSADFNFGLNNVTAMREKGDAPFSFNQNGNTFYMSPYNLGWCDPKNVYYLKRASKMEFFQYLPGDRSKPVATASLDIIQQGEKVIYKIGNNPYYQWGRKDPQVGFFDRFKHYKTNFGPTQFKIDNNDKSDLAAGIRNPHVMFVHTGSTKPQSEQQDWTVDRYMNLWNNSSDVTFGMTTSASLWNHVKTVYDPCPVGYMVPNGGIWRVLRKAIGSWSALGKTFAGDPLFGGLINGIRERQIDPSGIYVYIIYGDGTAENRNSYIYLVPTGNRWYSSGHNFKETQLDGQDEEIKAGQNFNLRLFYGWSSRWKGEKQYGAFSGSIGMDAVTSQNYFIGAHFDGRRAMGRPVRAIRDPNF